MHHKSAYAKVWRRLAPIRIETVQYERIAAEDRSCFNYTDDTDVLLHYPINQETRPNANITDLGQRSDVEKLCSHY